MYVLTNNVNFLKNEKKKEDEIIRKVKKRKAK